MFIFKLANTRIEGIDPVYLEGIACQPLPDAIVHAATTMGSARALEAAGGARARGYITKGDEERIREGVSR